ncbi:MAG TPA: hypothetical protein VM122_11375 [Usitatibacter sp.]|nr:hypothetical protein [Usitatibacter sp.]
MRRAMFVMLGTSAFLSSAAALGIGAGSAGPAQGLSRGEYLAAMRDIDTARADVQARCDAMAGLQARDLCRVEAAASEMLRAAELEQAYRRSEGSSRALQRARIDARYQVDRARCGTLGGFKRDKCLVKAHAAKGRAMLDAAAPYEVRF